MQKGQTLIFLLVGILVIAIAGGAFYLGKSTTPKASPNPVVTSQTATSTGSAETVRPDSIGANWKTVRTDFYEIKYPGDAYKQSSVTILKSLDEISLISINDTNQENGSQDVSPITIKITSKSKMSFTDPKQLFGQAGNIGYASDFFIKNREPQELTLNGNKGYILYGIGAGIVGIEREIIFVKGDNVFDIQVENSYTKENTKYKSLVDQIISTFKFL